jgi:uncharacterized small protein (DUF1192 family)
MVVVLRRVWIAAALFKAFSGKVDAGFLSENATASRKCRAHSDSIKSERASRCDNRRGGRYGGLTMPAIEDDDRPKKKLVHEIGQDLTLLSVRELDERIALLKEEIARLEADKVGKHASRQAADQFFKK